MVDICSGSGARFGETRGAGKSRKGMEPEGRYGRGGKEGEDNSQGAKTPFVPMVRSCSGIASNTW